MLAQPIAPIIPEADLLWVITATVLVFLMQAGFLALEAGLTRSKNAINVAVKNMADFGISTMLFWAVGFAMMFGTTSGGWVGTDGFMLSFDEVRAWPTVFFTFQVMFCGTAVTILSGAVAERMRFGAYLFMAMLVAGLTYPLFGHWAWNGIDVGAANGWLAARGFVDFAGSTVVHSVGGWTALAVLLVIGPRTGRYAEDGTPQKINGSNVPLATMGALLLFIGWLGFNGGSTLGIGPSVGRVIANTVLAGSAGMVASMLTGYWVKGRPEIEHVINGTLGGLVAITASAHAVDSRAAAIIGVVGGLVALYATNLLERFRIDDAVGAVPVHLGAGIWGTLAVGIFGEADLLGTGLSRLDQIGVQALGVFVCFLWVFVFTYLIVYAINRVMPFRVPPEAERVGLNIYEHGASTDLIDFFDVMDKQAKSGDLSLRSPVEPFTEVGQIANQYNQLMDSLQESETELRSYQGHLEELVDERTSALNESEARMGAILESASDGVITMDGEGRVLLWNRRATELFGYERAEMLGKPLTVIIPERFRQSHNAGYRRLAAGEEARLIGSSVELTGLHRDGHEFPIELSLGTWERVGEQFFSGIVRDISERMEAQTKLEATNEELDAAREAADAANEAKSSFLANMSHELRTPMNAIIGYSEMLTEDAEDDGLDDVVADLNKINAAGQHLLSLINDILDLSKIEAGRMDLFLETFDLHQIIVEVATTAHPLLETNHNQFVLDVDDQVGTVHLDLTKVRQSLLNLLSNAAKFTNNGTITLSVRAIARYSVPWIEMAVTDTGIGIPADKLGKVFEEFSQADESTTRDFGGTGLGLALTRQLCEMMGGGIELRSEIGVGSTFTIALPAVAEEAAPPIPGQSDEDSTADTSIDQTPHAGSILVIDDDPTARDMLHRMLEADGHTVLLASTADEGIDIASTAHPALITLDLLMPGVDGWSVLRALKTDEATKDIPVIVVSMVADRNTGLSLGAIDSLSKPVDRDRLLQLVRGHVASPDHSVLVVEDDEAARSMMQRTLTEAGISVIVAANGAQGLDIVRDNHIDLILLDLMMPVMDGFSFVAELRQEGHLEIPVIVVTAKDLTTEDLDRLEGKVEAIVAKGSDLEEQLLAQVRRSMPPTTAA